MTLKYLKPKLRQVFDLGHTFRCKVLSTTSFLTSSAILTAGSIIEIITKPINQRRQEPANHFYVVVKKKGSLNKMKKSFLQSMRKYFKIEESMLSKVNVETYTNNKVKISFVTNPNRNFDQLIFQQTRIYINNCRYCIKVDNNESVPL